MKYILLLVLIFIGCSNNFDNYREPWTDYSLNQLWKVTPITLDECFTQLDTILSKKAFSHFKSLDEQTAVVEISAQIGQAFISRWYLNPDVFSKTKATNIRSIFHNYGISDPLEMIRILFLAYHRRINGKDHNINSAIDTYSRFWINSKQQFISGSNTDYWTLNERMVQLEDSIYNAHVFRKRLIHDTLSISYFYAGNRFTKKPVSYSIQGVVVDMDSINHELKLKLIKINNEKEIPIWFYEDEKKIIGDLIMVKPKYWSKKNEEHFRYR